MFQIIRILEKLTSHSSILPHNDCILISTVTDDDHNTSRLTNISSKVVSALPGADNCGGIEVQSSSNALVDDDLNLAQDSLLDGGDGLS